MNKQISTGVGIAVIVSASLFLIGLIFFSVPKGYITKQNFSTSVSSEKGKKKPNSLARPDNVNYLITREDFSEETDGWKSYRNDQFGFEMKYPLGFYVDDSEDDTEYTPLPKKDLKAKRVVSISKSDCCQFSFEEGAELKVFFFDDVDKYKDVVENAYQAELSNPGDSILYYSDVDRYYYRNFEGVKNETLVKKDSDKSNRSQNLNLFLKTKKGFYYFMWTSLDPKDKGYDYEKYFIPMLSTFKYEENTPAED